MYGNLLKILLFVQLALIITPVQAGKNKDYSDLTYYSLNSNNTFPDAAYQSLTGLGDDDLVVAISLDDTPYQKEISFRVEAVAGKLYAPDIVVLDEHFRVIQLTSSYVDIDACDDDLDHYVVLNSEARYLVIKPGHRGNRKEWDICFAWPLLPILPLPIFYPSSVYSAYEPEGKSSLEIDKVWNERTRFFWSSELESNGKDFLRSSDNPDFKTPPSVNFHLGADVPLNPTSFLRATLGARFTTVNDQQQKGQMLYLGAGYRPTQNWNISAGLRAEFNRSQIAPWIDYQGDAAVKYDTSYGLRLGAGYHLGRSWSSELSATLLELETQSGVSVSGSSLSLALVYHFN